VGLALGIGVAVPAEASFAATVELGLAVAVAVAVAIVTLGLGLGLTVGVGDAVSPPHTLPAGTWQSAGATIRGSLGLSSVSESATLTSESTPPTLGPENVIAAPPLVHPMLA
jgi:hypothetical protein